MKTLPLLALLALAPEAGAETPEEKGLAIAEEMDHRDRGWGDQRADLVMTLRNRQGQESRRALRVSTLEVDGDGDKSLTVFDSPRDVKGTAFLSFTHAAKPDDQWLYLPALKRVKRISSANKSGPFMGSEFAYEDLASQEVDKYRYKWLRDETLDGRRTMVLERYPEYPHSGYTRQIAWIDAEMWQLVKGRVLRSQGRPAQDPHGAGLPAIRGSVLAPRPDAGGEPPDRQEHRPPVERLPLRHRLERARLRPERAQAGALRCGRRCPGQAGVEAGRAHRHSGPG